MLSIDGYRIRGDYIKLSALETPAATARTLGGVVKTFPPGATTQRHCMVGNRKSR
jgi:hypothetical protein